MLSDQEVERAAAQLAEYRQSNALSKLLEQYAVLIEDYKRLKSDYEEERETREKYKQMVRDQERNPFVLVLVDGDGYVFNETLLAKRAEGGSAAAQMLNDEIKASLRRKGLEHCQVMVRIYANVFGLSKVLSKAGLVGAESRSLGPFIANFNRAYGLTELVDAGELKENADSKLRALLHLYADNTQCKHIYFAACHDVGYISELTPFVGNSSKFTLVNTPGIRFHDEFRKLGMAIEDFRGGVFRHSPLDGTTSYRPSSNGVHAKTVPGPPQPGSPMKRTLAPNSAVSSATKKPICPFDSLGKCRYGKSCKLLHVTPLNETSSTAPQAAGLRSMVMSSATVDVLIELVKLPKKHQIPEGYVPVNKSNYRLDPYLELVEDDAMRRLKARIEKHRLCNNFHLQGSCDAGDRCEYDHQPLEPELLQALESLARNQPCTRRGSCRLQGCNHGHICQTPECRHRGGKAYCKIPHAAHLEDLECARYVPGVTKQDGKTANSGSGSSTTSG
ncbi:uncharacterized protein B0T15DRAFT_216339 [Chaetomium strumarium]|uniref:C3H1-type domain-containing protein n=1 Tax=Chaetomium strumarium TaxID=1170767 RepID=A0AAJ0GTZ3_9PEZI|nr:hypothetical protein B0T15DRAFT_216339 [Chaetomium strumarium]